MSSTIIKKIDIITILYQNTKILITCPMAAFENLWFSLDDGQLKPAIRDIC